MECLINPARHRGEAEITGTVLLCITPNEALALGRIAKEQGWRCQSLYHATLWIRPDGRGALCGPALGAPMAAMVLEKLIALGGVRFVTFGSCGALSPGLAIGDVLMPAWAVSQEGTSRHYPLSSTRVVPRVAGTLLAYLADHGVAAQRGGVWTTDAPYREKKETVHCYQELGVAAVDMELSALLSVAAFRGVDLAAVMVVSDLLSGESWQPGFSSKPYKRAVQRMVRQLFEYCERDGNE